jgi:hypothetical protein
LQEEYGGRLNRKTQKNDQRDFVANLKNNEKVANAYKHLYQVELLALRKIPEKNILTYLFTFILECPGVLGVKF